MRIDYRSRPLPSHVYFNGELVDRSSIVAVDETEGWIEEFVWRDREKRLVKTVDGKPQTALKDGIVRLVFAEKLY